MELMIKNFNPQQEPELIERAKLNIEKIIKYGISKYNNSQNVDISKIYGEKNRKRILVVGQVEDDASIIYGSEKRFNNNDLVVTARLENPEAEIIYKPHPDVLFGKRKELSNPKDVENICKIVTGSIPISQMLETVDHVYTITSQVGFEALLRGIKVTTLGAPFYSGWGLTDDRQIVERRNVKRTILDLFAVCYIKYPMYINPYTKKRIEIEDATRQAITEIAPNLVHVSKERIQVELTKLLLSDRPEAMKLVYETGISPMFLKHFTKWEKCLQICRLLFLQKKALRWALFLRKGTPEQSVRILRI